MSFDRVELEFFANRKSSSSLAFFSFFDRLTLGAIASMSVVEMKGENERGTFEERCRW